MHDEFLNDDQLPPSPAGSHIDGELDPDRLVIRMQREPDLCLILES